jgi:hypothetical protein
MTEPRVTEIHEETPQEEALRRWFEKQARKSPDTLEAAARTILGLVTALLGTLFGVLAVADDPLPVYFALPAVRWLGVGTVAALLLALIAALGVLLPEEMRVASARPDQQARAFRELLSRKSRWLTVAVIAFGLGLAALAAILIVALFTAV